MSVMEKRLSIVIIDDHPLFRTGVSQLVAMDAHFALVGEAASGQEDIELMKKIQPDLVLLDMNMKGMNGIETLKIIKAIDSNVLVVMLTDSEDEADVRTALQSGADGYLLKDLEPEALRARLLSGAEGSIVVSPSLRQCLTLAFNPKTHTVSQMEAALTEQETQILQRIAVGCCNKLIGRELNMTEGTVKAHVKHILKKLNLKKLNLKSRLEAAIWVLEQRS